MSEFPNPNNIPECTTSNKIGEENGCVTAQKYNSMFPALPSSKKNNLKNFEINELCTTSNATAKLLSQDLSSIQVFTISALDSKSVNCEDFGLEECNRICSDISKETIANIKVSLSKNVDFTFIVTGKKSNVIVAKKRIIESFQTRVTSTVFVPKKNHGKVMGKQGIRLKEIKHQIDVHIQVPSTLDTTEFIIVTGAKFAVENAVQEIRMLSDMFSKKVFLRIEIPKVFHPFITGGYNSKVNDLMKETGAIIHVPSPSFSKDQVMIAGNKESVKSACEEIKRIHEKMAKESTTIFVELQWEKQKYFLVDKESFIQDILLETDVSVEMPQPGSNYNTVFLRGLTKDLVNGLCMFHEKANGIAVETIECPMWMHMFLIGKNGSNLCELVEDNKKVHAEFLNNNKIIVEGPINMVQKVTHSLRQAIECHTYTEFIIDSKLFDQIMEKNENSIKNLKNDTKVNINTSKSKNNSYTIRIEGHKDGVKSAHATLEQIIHKCENEVEEKVPIKESQLQNIFGVKYEKNEKLMESLNVKFIFDYHSDEFPRILVKIQGLKEDVKKAVDYLTKVLNELVEAVHVTEIEISTKFHNIILDKGKAYLRKIREDTDVRIDLPRESKNSNALKIIGNKENVLIAHDRLKKIMDSLDNIVIKETAVNNNKVLNIIVKLGNKFIYSIQDDCGGIITLKLPDSKSNIISIKGPEDDVDNAIALIQTMVNEGHSSVIDLKVKQEFHKHLIGKKRVNLRRILHSTNTRIIFPLETNITNDVITVVGRKDDVETVKTEFDALVDELLISRSFCEELLIVEDKFHKYFIMKQGYLIQKLENECGGGVKISFPRTGNKVILRGPKANIVLAKQKILDYVQKLNRVIEIVVQVDPNLHHFFCAKRGETIHKITEDCNGVVISFPKKFSNDSGITIKGVQLNVEEAKRRITEKAELFKNLKEITMSVSPIYRPYFVTRRADVINRIIAEYNGMTICFPPIGSDSEKVIIKGHTNDVEKVKNKINHIVQDLEQRKTIEIIIPHKFHRFMYTNSDMMEHIMVDLDVFVKFPGKLQNITDQNICDSENIKNDDPNEKQPSNVSDIVKIIGKPENSEKTKLLLMDNLPKTIEFNLPHIYHKLMIGNKGVLINKLCSENNVQIQFPDEKLVSDFIEITGIQKNVDKVVEIIREQMQLYYEDKKLNLFEIQITIDPKFHFIIIGNKGENIRNISNKYNVYVKVPQRGEDSNKDVIKVTGRQKDIESARDEIIELVNKFKNNFKKEINIDGRVRSRIIGLQRYKLTQIMNQFNVDIKFSKPDSINSELVFVSAREGSTKDDVLECVDHLEMLQKDYLSDIIAREARLNLNQPQSVPNGTKTRDSVSPKSTENGLENEQFVCGNGTQWKKVLPDTSNTKEFPSMAGVASSSASNSQSNKNFSCWGK